MNEVAAAAEVSRRTLFRRFPSKADLVWDGVDEVLEWVRPRALSWAERKAPLRVLADELFAAALRGLDDPARAVLARRRLRLIAAYPELFNHRTHRELQHLIAEAVAANGSRGAAPPALVARTLVAVAFGAILWWADEGDGMTALETVRAAFAVAATVDRIDASGADGRSAKRSHRGRARLRENRGR